MTSKRPGPRSRSAERIGQGAADGREHNLNLNFRTGIYAPTGDYEVGRLANTGKNFWTFEPTLGLMYFGLNNGIEASVFVGADFNTENPATAPWLFNLYIDPKEELPAGHSMNAWLAWLAAEMGAHAATFKEYPQKKIGL